MICVIRLTMNFLKSFTYKGYRTGINLINKRIKFLTADGIEKGNGNCPSVLIAWGENAFNRIKNADGLIFRSEKKL